MPKQRAVISIDKERDLSRLKELAQDAGASLHFVGRLAVHIGLTQLSTEAVKAAQRERFHGSQEVEVAQSPNPPTESWDDLVGGSNG